MIAMMLLFVNEECLNDFGQTSVGANGEACEAYKHNQCRFDNHPSLLVAGDTFPECT